eukprot:1884476-Amphidinium_carterae.1
MAFDEAVEELVVLRSDPPLTMEARQSFLEHHCGPSSCVTSSSSLPMMPAPMSFSVSMTISEVPPPPPPLLSQMHPFPVEEVEEIPPWVMEYERATSKSVPLLDEEEELPSWATDFGKALAVQVVSTTSQLSPSTLLQVEEDDDFNHYWAMQSMAPARLPPPPTPPPPQALVSGSDSATSLGLVPSSPRASSPDSFHSCASIKAMEEESSFQAAVVESFIHPGAPTSSIPEDYAVVTPLPRKDAPKFDNEYGSCAPAALPDHQVDTDYISDDDYDDESSSSDEDALDCVAPADRYLTVDSGVHEWHIDHPSDPRDLRAPFLRTLRHDQVADGTGATFHVSTSFPGNEVLESKEADWSKLSTRHLVAVKEAKTRADADLSSEVFFTYPVDTLVFILQTVKLGPIIRAKVRFCLYDFDTTGPEVGWITVCVLPHSNEQRKVDKTFKFFRKAKDTDFSLLRDHIPCHIFQCFDWKSGEEDLLVGHQALRWLVAAPETTALEGHQHFVDFGDKDEDEKTDFLTGMLTQALPNQATARIKLRIALHPCTTDSSLGVIVPPLVPQDIH